MDPENIYFQDEILLSSYFFRCDQSQWKIRHLRIRQGKGNWDGYQNGTEGWVL